MNVTDANTVTSETLLIIKGKQTLDPALGDKQPQDMSTQQGRAAAGRGQR